MGNHSPFRSRGSDSSGWAAVVTFCVVAGLVLTIIGIAYALM